MISGMVALEDRSDGGKTAVRVTQDWERRNCEMFPGDNCERGGKDRAQDLRDFDDALATEAIGQMTGWQGKADDGNGKDQTDKAKRSGRMGARVNFPFHGDREHLPPHDGKKIAAREKHVAARAKRRVGIMRPRFRNNGRSGALSGGRIVFVRLRIGASRHVRARCSEHAHKIVKSLARGATSRVRHWPRLPLEINARFSVPVAQLDRASDFGSEGWGFESLQARFLRPNE